MPRIIALKALNIDTLHLRHMLAEQQVVRLATL